MDNKNEKSNKNFKSSGQNKSKFFKTEKSSNKTTKGVKKGNTFHGQSNGFDAKRKNRTGKNKGVLEQTKKIPQKNFSNQELSNDENVIKDKSKNMASVQLNNLSNQDDTNKLVFDSQKATVVASKVSNDKKSIDNVDLENDKILFIEPINDKKIESKEPISEKTVGEVEGFEEGKELENGITIDTEIIASSDHVELSKNDTSTILENVAVANSSEKLETETTESISTTVEPDIKSKKDSKKKQKKDEVITFDSIKSELDKLGDDSKIFTVYRNKVSTCDLKKEQLLELLELGKTKVKDKPLYLLTIYNNLPKEKKAGLTFVKDEISFYLKNFTMSNETKLKMIQYSNEEEALEYIKSLNEKLGDTISKSVQTNAIVIYLWFMSSNGYYKSIETSKRAYVFEKAFLRYFNTLTDKKFNSIQCRLIPKCLENKNFDERFNSFYYLFDEQIKENEFLNQKVVKLQAELKSNQLVLSNKIVENHAIQESIIELEKNITILELEKSNLKNDLELAKGKLIFEENQNSAKLDTLKDDIVDDFKNGIMIELEGINDLLDQMPDRTREKLERRLSKIEKRLSRGN